MKRISTLILTLILFPLLTKAQITSDLSQQFKQELDNAVKFHNVKGISAAVIMPDGRIWEGVSGMATETDSLTKDMLFFAASNTKTFVAATILKLAEEGQLSLEDELHLYLPALHNIDPNITIRQLLGHNSGIYNYTDNEALWTAINAYPDRIISPEEILSKYVKGPEFKPGTDWRYSNTNYILLSLIIESVTGKTLHSELRDRFIDPLHLDHTSMGAYEAQKGKIGGFWIDLDDDQQLDDASFFPNTSLLSSAWGAGGLVSKPIDLVKWLSNLYSGNVLEEHSLHTMQQEVPYSRKSNRFYGLGIQGLSFLGYQFFGHDGSLVHTSMMLYSPDDNFGIAIMLAHGSYNFEAIMRMANHIKNQLATASIATTESAFYTLNAFPNPFAEKINIAFELEETKEVQLSIYDAAGKKVRLIANQKAAAGNHYFEWDGRNQAGAVMPNGLYLFELWVDNQQFSNFILLQRG